jgi:hypothetical protein
MSQSLGPDDLFKQLQAVSDRLYRLERATQNIVSQPTGFMRSTTSVSVATSTEVAIPYGSTGYDLGGIIDSANSRFVVPEDGIYQVVLKGVFTSNATGIRGLEIWRNEELDWYENQMAVNGEATEFSTGYSTRNITGDRLAFKLWQTSGITLTTCFAEMFIHKASELG